MTTTELNTKETQDNQKQCSNCGKHFIDNENDYVVDSNGDIYCEDCRDEHLSYCERCNEYSPSDDFVQIENLNMRIVRFCNDYYTTATGRLLLSSLPPQKAKALLGKFKISDFSGNKIDIDKFIDELFGAPPQDYIYWKHPINNIQLAGALIKIKNMPVAAIGFGTTKDLNDVVKPALKECVEEIKQQFCDDNVMSKYSFS